MSRGVTYSWAVIIKILGGVIEALVAVSLGLLFSNSPWQHPLTIAGALSLLLVGYYVFRKVFMGSEAGDEPADTPPSVQRESVGILIEGGQGNILRNNTIKGMGVGIKAVNTKDLHAEGNDIS